MKVPVIVGNTVTFNATRELMQTGVAAVLIGVGPGRPARRGGARPGCSPGDGDR